MARYEFEPRGMIPSSKKRGVVDNGHNSRGVIDGVPVSEVKNIERSNMAPRRPLADQMEGALFTFKPG